jgi:para-nitrobenzyl esterase
VEWSGGDKKTKRRAMKTKIRKLKILVSTGLLAFTVAPVLAHNSDDHNNGPVVQTADGPVRGLTKNRVNQFLGIPYAAPPVGDLRWRPPVRHAKWRNVRDATKFGATCAQISLLGVYAGPPNANEDCLFLNVYKSATNAPGKLPVIVYFHGGGEEGESNDFDGSKLATQGRTIVVTVNFRLSLMGVLSHPALDNEGHLFGNYNILDQQMALRWVQDNIGKFGGDSRNVTIAGQSYGAKAVTYEILSPLSKGLFDRAITQSALVYLGSTPLDVARQKGIAFAVAAGCGSGTDAATAKCLRALPAKRVQELMGNGVHYRDQGDTGRAPYVVSGAISDGQILPVSEIEAYKNGKFNHVPLMTGSTADEGSFGLMQTLYYRDPRTPLTEDQFVASIQASYGGNAGPGGTPPAYPAGTADRVLTKYPLSNYQSVPQQWIAATTDPTFGCRQHHMVALLYKQVPLYYYEFRDRTAPSYFPKLPDFNPGAYHTGDSQYVFGGYHGGPLGETHQLNRKQLALSDKIIKAWANFAWTGNPNRVGNVPWPRFTGMNGHILIENLDGFSTITDGEYLSGHKCDFWDTVSIYP